MLVLFPRGIDINTLVHGGLKYVKCLLTITLKCCGFPSENLEAVLILLYPKIQYQGTGLRPGYAELLGEIIPTKVILVPDVDLLLDQNPNDRLRPW